MNNLKLISASAGSGKTYSLTKMVLEAVIDGVAPERIMAVTFTNKAAAELKERIRQKLVQPEAEWIAEKNLDSTQLQQLREQAASLSDAYVGTVNSICARLLREFAFAAGLSPAIDILPEEEADRLFRLAVSQELSQYYPALSAPARRLGRDGSGSGYAKKPDWRNDVKTLVNLARANGLRASELNAMANDSVAGLAALLGNVSQSLNSDELLQRVDAVLAEILGLEDTTKGTRDAVSYLRKVAHALRHHYATWADWSGLAKLEAGKSSGANDCLDAVREYALKVQHHPELHADVKQVIEGVFACAAESLESFDRYKRVNGLMDFVDQESKVLELLDHDDVRQRIRERIDLLMVDEFQDTSPIQLALFTRLSGLVDRSVWVGDQKQAIYGFRGTDPVLMDRVIDQLRDDQLVVLENSWRSRKGLVDFTNAVFAQAFAPMAAERIRLNAKRSEPDELGEPLAVWRIHGDNKLQRADALAAGIAGLLKHADDWKVADREDGSIRPLRAGDIAVLCRLNDNCGEVAEALGRYGISASYGRGQLFSEPECAAVLAGLRLLVDDQDTLALAELVQYLPDHTSASSWLDALIEQRDQAFDVWKADERIQRLLALRDQVTAHAPLELMQMVVDLLDVRRDMYGSADPKQCLANLEALEQWIGQYQDSCKARHQGASLPGLIYWLACQEDVNQPEGRGEQTVQIISYHRSKGLEWPLVILFDLNSAAKYSPFGAHVHADGAFDPEQPLANRHIRYWPQPLSGKDLPFIETVEASEPYQQAMERELAERKRLMYVGMTRARDYLILTQPRGSRAGDTLWLTDLIPDADAAITLPEPDDQTPAIGVGEARFSCLSQQCYAQEEAEQIGRNQSQWHLPPARLPDTPHAPYAVVPSQFDLLLGESGCADAPITLGERTLLPADVDMVHVGEAVHALFAADRTDLDREQRMAVAASILSGWSVEGMLTASQLIDFSDRLHTWITAQWPDATVRKEWPMRMCIGEQVAHGWIDMVLELPQGYIVIDHKSYAGDAPAEKASSYAGQLAAYKQAIEQASGKPVLQTLIHMPLQGMMIPLRCDG